MLKRVLFFLFINLTASMWGQAPSYRQVIDSLAKAPPGDPISLPDSFFVQSESQPLGQLQRGTVLYASAGRARELNNLGRMPVLVAEAKTRLASAYAGLSASLAIQKSHCQYHIGLIAEQYDGNLATAETAYQLAVDLYASNTAAQRALARVRYARNVQP